MGWTSQPTNTTSTVKNEPPAYIKPYAEDLLSGGAQIASQPYNPYPGMTIAPLSPEHQAAMYMGTQLALNGNPAMNAAQGFTGNIMSGIGTQGANTLGRFMSGEDMMFGLGLASDPAGRMIAAQTNPIRDNPLMGLENPYLNQQIANAQGEMTDAYMNTTVPQLGYGYRQSGSYGNTGQQQLAMQAEDQLQENLGQIANNMRMQDYNLQAQLQEQDIARRTQAFELQKQAELGQFGDWRNARLGAWNTGADRQLAAGQSGVQAGLEAANMAPTFAQNDRADVQMLMGIGDAQRTYQQQLLDAARGEWDAAQNWPYSQYDWMANLIRGAGFGTYGQSTSTGPNPNAGSNLANLVGGGMALGGLADAFDWI